MIALFWWRRRWNDNNVYLLSVRTSERCMHGSSLYARVHGTPTYVRDMYWRVPDRVRITPDSGTLYRIILVTCPKTFLLLTIGPSHTAASGPIPAKIVSDIIKLNLLYNKTSTTNACIYIIWSYEQSNFVYFNERHQHNNLRPATDERVDWKSKCGAHLNRGAVWERR